MFKKLGLQIFSVRNYLTDAESIRKTLERLAAIGYSELQLAGRPRCEINEFMSAVKDNGFEIVGTHHPFPEDVDNIEDYVNEHRIFGTTNAGVGGAFNIAKDMNAAKDFIEKANRLAENLDKYGMKFTYHHHAFEFAKLGNDRIIDVLMKEFDPRIDFVIDTFWLQSACVSITEWMEKLAGRCQIMHLKDGMVKPGENVPCITECGNGNLNFKEIIKVADEIGVKHLCVEQDYWPEGFDSVDYCMRKSYEHLSQFLEK